MSSGKWTPKSWNTCAKCKNPVEGPGGDVEFFDGSEARCIGCNTVYVVVVFKDGSAELRVPREDEDLPDEDEADHG